MVNQLGFMRLEDKPINQNELLADQLQEQTFLKMERN